MNENGKITIEKKIMTKLNRNKINGKGFWKRQESETSIKFSSYFYGKLIGSSIGCWDSILGCWEDEKCFWEVIFNFPELVF